jgi:excisionase family DNA binding protein
MGEAKDASQDRVTIQEAARRLGVKEDAIRKRIQRGSMRHEKAEDGRVYVWVDASQDATQDTGRSSQDTYQDTSQDERLVDLREQVGYLRRQLDEEREARRRADTIIAQLARANEEQARTIRELEAPSEPSPDERESPETDEEAPEGAEPHPARGEAQEGTDRPQQRSGWLAPVDRLPWWHYVLGISLVILGAVLASSYWQLPELPVGIAMMYAQIWLPSGIFGLWVGYRMRSLRLLQIITLGALVGIVSWLGWVGVNDIVRTYVWRTYLHQDYQPLSDLVEPFYLSFVPACMFYVFASLIGNAWQRRRIGRISGTTPASPVSRTRQRAAQQPRKDLTPAQQAMVGWGGTIISALLSLLGVIITVRGGS